MGYLDIRVRNGEAITEVNIPAESEMIAVGDSFAYEIRYDYDAKWWRPVKLMESKRFTTEREAWEALAWQVAQFGPDSKYRIFHVTVRNYSNKGYNLRTYWN
jgi:hypothetical protein